METSNTDIISEGTSPPGLFLSFDGLTSLSRHGMPSFNILVLEFLGLLAVKGISNNISEELNKIEQ